jgi:hypothetical protein
MHIRSYWIPGSYAPALSEKCNSFLRLLKNKGFKEERMTKVGLHAIGKSTTRNPTRALRDMVERRALHHITGRAMSVLLPMT